MSKHSKVKFIITITALIVVIYSASKSSNKIENIQDNTIVINGITLVFLEPEKDWIARTQKENYDSFTKINANNSIYGDLVRKNYEDKNMKIVSTTKRYLNFIKDNGKEILMDRNSINMDGWGVYIFDGKQDPMDVSLSTIQNETD